MSVCLCVDRGGGEESQTARQILTICLCKSVCRPQIPAFCTDKLAERGVLFAQPLWKAVGSG